MDWVEGLCLFWARVSVVFSVVTYFGHCILLVFLGGLFA